MDAAFISADEDVPALIDEVRRLRALGAALAHYEIRATEEYGDPTVYLECTRRDRLDVSANYRTMAELVAEVEKHEQEAHR